MSDYNSNRKTQDYREVRMDPKPQSQAAAHKPQANGELEDVFGTKEDSEALVVKGLLDSAGIDSVIVSLDAPQQVLPGVGGVVIRVAPEDAEEARRLIDEYRSSARQEADADEDDGEFSGSAA